MKYKLITLTICFLLIGNSAYAAEASDNAEGPDEGGTTFRFNKTIPKEKNFYRVSEGLNYVVPFGDLKKFTSYGAGLSLELGVADFYIKNFFIGSELGFQQYECRDKTDRSFMMIPLYLSAGYRVLNYRDFYLLPQLYFGAGLNIITNNTDNRKDADGQYSYTQKETVDSSFKFILRSGYSGKLFHGGIALGYGAFIEKSGILHFAMISLFGGVQW